MKKLENMTEPDLKNLMNAIGLAILETAEDEMVEKPMFVLVLFNDPALGQYISNCKREDVIKAMRETADRLDRMEDVPRSIGQEDKQCYDCRRWFLPLDQYEEGCGPVYTRNEKGRVLVCRACYMESENRS